MNSGVRNALGPGLRSFRRENSLQGGADHSAPGRGAKQQAVLCVVQNVAGGVRV